MQCPRSYLWLSGSGRGSAHISGPFSNAFAPISPRTLSGMPISASTTSPHRFRPGYSKCPGFLRKKLTVHSAWMATPRNAPLAPSMPLGTSTATTGLPLAFTAWINAARSPSMSRSRPAPSSASTISSAPPIAPGDAGSTEPFHKSA